LETYIYGYSSAIIYNVTTKTKIIDGKAIAADIRQELKSEISGIKGRKPGLAVILVGDDPASHYYVGSKQKACTEVGMESFKTVLSASASEDELIEVIEKYNADSNVDGILLQLPLPDSLRANTQEIIDTISPTKDVDGLTSFNLGQLVVKSDTAVEPCTPKGCMELLKRSGVDVSGKKALVIGRSTLVGKPISLLLNNANATVTMAHSRTKDLQKEVSEADILIAAIGVPEFVSGDWIKNNAVVIDVGINAIDQGEGQKRKLVGDVNFLEAEKKASLITPVPGGVGPMTVAMLLTNTLELYRSH
jgi:methylenetetrahydrofolate dehydrogenase (NADP+)/methenyltetrahydrofolate cyclohydrolase